MDGLPALPSVPVAPELEHGPGLVASVWRWRWLVAGLTLLGAVAGLGIAGLQPTLYQGVARVLPAPGLTVEEGTSVDPVRTLHNQAAVMSSAPVLTEVARRFGDTDTALLRERVRVVASRDADVLTVTALDPTPEGAARLANAVVQAYQETVAGSSRQEAESRVTGLREQRERLGDRLREIRAGLAAEPDDPVLAIERRAVSEQYQSMVAQEQQLLAAAGLAGQPGLVESAEVPARPERPQPLPLAGAGALAGLALALALAWWLRLGAFRLGASANRRPGGRRGFGLPLGAGALLGAGATQHRVPEPSSPEREALDGDWSASEADVLEPGDAEHDELYREDAEPEDPGRDGRFSRAENFAMGEDFDSSERAVGRIDVAGRAADPEIEDLEPEDAEPEDAEREAAEGGGSRSVVAAQSPSWLLADPGEPGALVPPNGTEGAAGVLEGGDPQVRAAFDQDPTGEVPEPPDELDRSLLRSLELSEDDPWAPMPARSAAAFPARLPDAGPPDGPDWDHEDEGQDARHDEDDDDWDDWDDWDDLTGDVIGGPTGDPTGDILGLNGSAWSASLDSTDSIPDVAQGTGTDSEAGVDSAVEADAGADADVEARRRDGGGD